MGPTSHFISSLSNFLNFVLEMWAIKRCFILTIPSSRWWVQAVPPGQLPHLGGWSVQMPPLSDHSRQVLKGRVNLYPGAPCLPKQFIRVMQHSLAASYLPVLCFLASSSFPAPLSCFCWRKSWKVGSRCCQRIDLAALASYLRSVQSLGFLQPCAIDSALKAQKENDTQKTKRKGTLLPS